MDNIQEVLDKLASSVEKLEKAALEKQAQNQALKAEVDKMTSVVTQAYERIDRALKKLEESDGGRQL